PVEAASGLKSTPSVLPGLMSSSFPTMMRQARHMRIKSRHPCARRERACDGWICPTYQKKGGSATGLGSVEHVNNSTCWESRHQNGESSLRRSRHETTILLPLPLRVYTVSARPT